MNSANINETKAVNFATGFNNKQMTHSTSVNTLSKKPGTPVILAHQNERQAQQSNTNMTHNIYQRYSPHNQQSHQQPQHSQSTANLMNGNKQLSYTGASSGSGTRQSATNGLKFIPSSSLNGNGQRNESPANGGQSIQLAHTTNYNHNNSSNNNNQNIQQIKSRQVMKGANGSENSGGKKSTSSHHGTVRQQSSSGIRDNSANNMLQTMVQNKDNNRQGGLKIVGGITNKQAKSFTSSLETMPASTASAGHSSKPPSNSNKIGVHQHSQQLRTIDQISKGGSSGHHQISHTTSSKDGSSHFQSLSHMRTQVTLGSQKNSQMNSNQISNSNSRQQKQEQHHSKKRGGEHSDQEKSNKSSFSNKNILSQQPHHSSGSQSRLISHKTALNDFKKPVSLTQNPIGSHSAKNQVGTQHQHPQQTPVSFSTPTSQVVSHHSYQPGRPNSSSHQAKQQSTFSSHLQQQQTPTTISTSNNFKTGQKPPIGSESTKHIHSNSLQTNTFSSSIGQQHHARHSTSTHNQQTTSSSNNAGGKRNSPRNQLNVFTKKQSFDASSKQNNHHHGSNSSSAIISANYTKQNFSNTSTNLQSALSPKDGNENQQSKRRTSDLKSQIFGPGGAFKSSSHVQSSSHPQSQSTSQHRQSTSLKNQVTSQAKGDKKQINHHSSASSSQNQLKVRNGIGKIGGSVKEHHNHGNKGKDIHQINPTLDLPSESSHHRSQTKKMQQVQQQQLQYAQTTKNNNQPQILGAGRSSSVSLNNQGKDFNSKDKSSTTPVGKSYQALQQTSGGTSSSGNAATLDRFKDKHPKLHNQQSSSSHQQETSTIGHQTTAKVNGGVPSIHLNAYKQRSASPSDAATNSKSNISGMPSTSNQTSSKQQATQQTQSHQNSAGSQNPNQKSMNSFVTQLSHKMAQNRVPQINGSTTTGGSSQQAEEQKGSSRDQRFSQQQEMSKLQPSSVNHQHKMQNGNKNNVQNQIFQRKVRSATRASEFDQEQDKRKKTQPGSSNLNANFAQHTNHHKLSKQKFTDRPSSASAGQTFIGRQQNLKELFERNWQSVNIQNKVDPQSGEATQIRTLTVVDANSMVHEDQQEAAALALAPGTRIIIPNHEPTKCSNKRNGIVRAYAANTNQGLVRNYNEDRVSIILNIVKPEHRKHETWPTCSFFGVYDGHGGSACAEYLRDNLHHYVIKEENFPWEPEDAITKGFAKAEARFLEMCQAKDESTGQMTVIERSGSCAIVILIVGEICYTANVGDSRAVLSSAGGQQLTALSRDHKPSDTDEYKRIIQAGGQIYQTTTSQILNQHQLAQQQINKGTTGAIDPEFIVGPIRVLPGRLSVCRTFGDPEAKLQYRNGNPNVVCALPDIRSFQISKQHDFIVLASDGIFDKLTDDDIGKAVWLTCEAAKQAKSTLSAGQVVPTQIKQQEQNISVHQYCGLGVEGILKNSLMRQSLDNVTVVMVAFQNFKRMACGQTQTGSAEKPNESTSRQQSSAKKTSSEKAAQLQQTTAETTNKPTEKENSNFMSNGKKIAIARSQQNLMARNSNDRPEPAANFQERQLKRQTGEHSIPRQTLNSENRLQSNNNHVLPRTRSQTHEIPSEQHDQIVPSSSNPHARQQQYQQSSHLSKEGFSIRQQQEQANKMSQQQQQFDNARQQAKPPMANQLGQASAIQKASTKTTYQHREQIQGGMRSLSLKEVKQAASSNNSGDQAHQNNNNFHGQLNHLANLNSNKSLGSTNNPHGTPSTQSSSLKSGSIGNMHNAGAGSQGQLQQHHRGQQPQTRV